MVEARRRGLAGRDERLDAPSDVVGGVRRRELRANSRLVHRNYRIRERDHVDAVCEAYVDGMWCAVDATALAPRSSLVRIATGRDAADTAFMTVVSGHADLIDMVVGAVVDVLPDDDMMAATHLG